MNQSPLQRSNNGLGAVRGVESHQNCADVAFDSCFGDTQKLPDLFVAVPGSKQLQDLSLSMTEVGIGSA